MSLLGWDADWSSLIASSEKSTSEMRKEDQKYLHSLSIFQTEAITAAIIQCPNWQIEELYSNMFSFFLLLSPYFCLLFPYSFQRFQLLIAQWSSFISRKKRWWIRGGHSMTGMWRNLFRWRGNVSQSSWHPSPTSEWCSYWVNMQKENSHMQISGMFVT